MDTAPRLNHENPNQLCHGKMKSSFKKIKLNIIYRY
jgi:hypothetical protein